MRFFIIVLFALTLTGCGKTLEQVKKAAHDLIDIAGKVYEDGKDNVETAKKAVTPEPGK